MKSVNSAAGWLGAIFIGAIILASSVSALTGCDVEIGSRGAFASFVKGCPGRVAWARTDGQVERPLFAAQCLPISAGGQP